MILYVNACVRTESRTNELAKALLDLIGKPYTERKLSEDTPLPLSEERLAYRTRLIDNRDYQDPIFDDAKEFSIADTIVISAPYWDLSFPTILKAYIENIYVAGIVTRYRADGMPEGLCRAGKLYYVTTAGGPYDLRFSYDYIADLCTQYFGIKQVSLVKAEFLDIAGIHPEAVIRQAKNDLRL